MTQLSRLILVECSNVTVQMLEGFISQENELGVLRVWSCPRVQQEEKLHLQKMIRDGNLDLYFEWFA